MQSDLISNINASINYSRKLYLDLMKKCLMNTIYHDYEFNPVMPKTPLRRIVINGFRKIGFRLCHDQKFTLQERIAGIHHTSIAHTMVSLARLNNLELCVQSVLRDGVKGDLIETGVLRGGCVIFMRAILEVYEVKDRIVWVADSFEGLPPPDPEQYPADAGAKWHLYMGGDVSEEHVRRNFELYGLLDNQVHFLKGWFKDTLPKAPINQLSILRLDGDMYESTMEALVNLYPKLSVGGYLIIDDYNLEGCAKAVQDYRQLNNISEEIVDIDGAGAYWRRQY